MLDDLLEGETAADTWWFDGRRIGEAEIVQAFAPLVPAIDRDVAALGDGALDYQRHHARVPRARCDVDRAIGSTSTSVSGWLRKLIDVAYTTEMGLEIDQQSALNLLTFIGTEDADAFKIFGESDERFHVRGGNDLIPRTLAKRMAESIETGHVLEAVRADGDGLRLTFRRDGASIDVRAQQAILALPFTLLRKVRIDLPLPAHKRNAIDHTGLRHQRQADDRLRPPRRGATHDANGASMSDLPYQTTWETSRKQPGAAGTLTNFTGGRHGVELGQGTPARAGRCRDRRARARVARASPLLAHGAARSALPLAHASLVAGQLCVPPSRRLVDAARRDGRAGRRRCIFAGEHCALDTQGFMEGGCESGRDRRPKRSSRSAKRCGAAFSADSGAPDRRASALRLSEPASLFFAVQRAIHR